MLYTEILKARLNKGEVTVIEALNWLRLHGVTPSAAWEMLHGKA